VNRVPRPKQRAVAISGRLAQRFKMALDEWTIGVSELATWIRYSPPPPGTRPAEPRVEDPPEDHDDGGPDTTH
jgi:hypothetical protein